MDIHLRLRRSRLLARLGAYALSVGLPALVWMTQMRAHEVSAPLFMFFFAAVLATLAGGMGPGLTAVACGAGMGNASFLGPAGELSLTGSAGQTTGMFVVAGLTMVVLQEARRRAARSVQDALHGRDRFIAIAGHELANPLSALELQVQARRRRLQRVAQAAATDAGPAKAAGVDVAWLLTGIEQELDTIARLRALVRELLDVSRIRSGTLQLRPCASDLAALVRAVAARFDEAAHQAGCALNVEAPTAVPGFWDPMRIEQVVANLVTNALKYGAGAPVTLTVVAVPEGGQLVVRDGGPGIALADQARIFGRFERLEGTRAQAGLGLGLWIVAQIVAASGGTVTVTSDVGHGAAFTVTLPAHEPAAPGNPTGAAAAGRLTSLKARRQAAPE